MPEFLFLIAFAATLFFVGLSVLGVVAGLIVGFVVMMLAGMLGTLFKLLPWIVLIAAGVWFLKSKDDRVGKYRDDCRAFIAKQRYKYKR